MTRLAIVTSHPIQYNAPWFAMLANRGVVLVKVFYTWEQSQQGSKFDPGFGKAVSWDIPLLKGYDFTFVKNIAKHPGSHNYKGLNNPTLIKEIEAWRADALLIITWAHKSHLQCMRHFHKKIPILFRGDSTLLNEKPGVKKYVRTTFLRWVYSHIDIGLFVGKNNKDYYIRHGLTEKQLVFTPHAIDNSRFTKNETEYKLKALQWRQKLNIPGHALVFLFAGKLEPVKNPELLVEAFLELNDASAHLVMVGNGVNEAGVKQLAGTAANIHFVDFQNQSVMPVVYHLCDVFVLPSRSETWGLAINEAMVCEKAVLVSSKCGAAVDLVEVGKNGFIFKSENKYDLLEKMKCLVSLKDELRNFGNHSSSIIENYNFENICKAIEKCVPINKEADSVV